MNIPLILSLITLTLIAYSLYLDGYNKSQSEVIEERRVEINRLNAPPSIDLKIGESKNSFFEVRGLKKLEILNISSEGKIFHRGKEIYSKEERVEAFEDAYKAIVETIKVKEK